VLQPLLEIAPDIDIPGHGPARNFAALVAGQTIARLA
jgi:2-amino-4-hydroxy-6-hydroxymethyldihydropteridine diphosphokinase